MRSITAAFVTLLCLATVGGAIKCYECQDCKKENKTLECADGVNNCIISVISGKIIRSCGKSNVTSTGCEAEVAKKMSSVVCTCSGDLCNTMAAIKGSNGTAANKCYVCFNCKEPANPLVCPFDTCMTVVSQGVVTRSCGAPNMTEGCTNLSDLGIEQKTCNCKGDLCNTMKDTKENKGAGNKCYVCVNCKEPVNPIVCPYDTCLTVISQGAVTRSCGAPNMKKGCTKTNVAGIEQKTCTCKGDTCNFAGRIYGSTLLVALAFAPTVILMTVW